MTRIHFRSGSRDSQSNESSRDCPILTEIVDEALFKSLTAAGLKVPDARHLMYAACNGCDRFVTLDLEHFINNGRRTQLEALCPGLKIVTPSELAAELSIPSAISAT